MTELLFSLLFFAIIIPLMAVGYIVAKKKLTGSCGGLGQLFGACDMCENKHTCDKKQDVKDDTQATS